MSSQVRSPPPLVTSSSYATHTSYVTTLSPTSHPPATQSTSPGLPFLPNSGRSSLSPDTRAPTTAARTAAFFPPINSPSNANASASSSSSSSSGSSLAGFPNIPSSSASTLSYSLSSRPSRYPLPMPTPAELISLHSLDLMSSQLSAAGKLVSSLACLERSLLLRVQLFGPGSPQALAAARTAGELCNYLAMTFLQQDLFPVALELLRKAEVLSARLRPVRAVTLNNLACLRYGTMVKTCDAYGAPLASIAIEHTTLSTLLVGADGKPRRVSHVDPSITRSEYVHMSDVDGRSYQVTSDHLVTLVWRRDPIATHNPSSAESRHPSFDVEYWNNDVKNGAIGQRMSASYQYCDPSLMHQSKRNSAARRNDARGDAVLRMSKADARRHIIDLLGEASLWRGDVIDLEAIEIVARWTELGPSCDDSRDALVAAAVARPDGQRVKAVDLLQPSIVKSPSLSSPYKFMEVTVDADHRYVLANGSVTHNCYYRKKGKLRTALEYCRRALRIEGKLDAESAAAVAAQNGIVLAQSEEAEDYGEAGEGDDGAPHSPPYSPSHSPRASAAAAAGISPRGFNRASSISTTTISPRGGAGGGAGGSVTTTVTSSSSSSYLAPAALPAPAPAAKSADTHINMCAILSELRRHEKAIVHARIALRLLLMELFGEVDAVHKQQQAQQMQQRMRSSASASAEYALNQEAQHESLATGMPPSSGMPIAPTPAVLQLTLPPDRVAVLAIAYHNLAVQLDFLRRTPESLVAYSKAHRVVLTHLGKNHPLVASITAAQSEAKSRAAREGRNRGGGAAGAGDAAMTVQYGVGEGGQVNRNAATTATTISQMVNIASPAGRKSSQTKSRSKSNASRSQKKTNNNGGGGGEYESKE